MVYVIACNPLSNICDAKDWEGTYIVQ